MRFIDIGANLVDSMFAGVYNGKVKHEPDLEHVLSRARTSGVDRILVTSGSLEEAVSALELVRKHDWLYTTVGVHPTRCGEFVSAANGADRHLAALAALIDQNRHRVVAVGECGLDFDRLNFCDKDTQLRYFALQLQLAERTGLPLFLHCRASCDSLLTVLQANNSNSRSGGGGSRKVCGVVHSFDGSLDEAHRIMELGLDIGINGCSLKTAANLAVVAQLPAERLHLETDAPWCHVRPSHAGHCHIRAGHCLDECRKEKWRPDCAVKSRNEPANIRQVLDVVAAVKNADAETLAETIYQNSMTLFFPNSV